MASRVLAVIAFTTLFGYSLGGSGFLAAPELKLEDLEAGLLNELSNGSEQRLLSLEASLRPMFAAVPKEHDGTLGHNVVRYVLQRFFAHEHGWFIRGLEPNQASNISDAQASLQAMQEWAPIYLQNFLEKVMAGRGIGLRELAVFAATLEDLIHREEKGHLLQAYKAVDQSTNVGMDPTMAFDVLQTYMMIYMLGGNWTVQMASQVDHLMQLFSKKVSHWDDTLVWLKNLVSENVTGSVEEAPLTDFSGALHVASEIGNRFATFNTGECSRLKEQLMGSESAKPGRIRLVDFYKMGLKGAWEFNEKVDFLRDIGTLDESDPTTPLVILPNYVQARTNCLAVSDFYAVCCPNECEGLMQQLEGQIATSTARPSQISRIVSKLSSPTVSAPRHLSKPLMQRLQDIASHHGGEIPLHGRLFAQWMHHAFPRECPYPHAAGTASAQTADEWMTKTGQADSTLTEEEMLAEVAGDTCRLLPKGVQCHGHVAPSQHEDDEELPWDSSEELLVVRDPQPVAQASQMRPLHDIMMWCALSSMVYGLVWALKYSDAGKRLSIWAGVPIWPTATKPVACSV